MKPSEFKIGSMRVVCARRGCDHGLQHRFISPTDADESGWRLALLPGHRTDFYSIELPPYATQFGRRCAAVICPACAKLEFEP